MMTETNRLLLIIFTMLAMGLGVASLVVSVLMSSQIPHVTMETRAVLDLLTYKGSPIAEYAHRASKLCLAAPSFSILITVFAFIAIGVSKPVPLFVFSAFGFIVAAVQITAISLWYPFATTINQQFSDNGTFKTLLVSNLDSSYKVDSITVEDDNLSRSWNYLFLERKCCGINPVPVGMSGDFVNSYWVRSGAAASQRIPTSCCINVTSTSYTAPTTCKDNVNLGTYYYTGCLANLENWFDFSNYSKVNLGLGVAIIIVQVAASIFAFFYGRKLRTEEYDVKKGKFSHIKQSHQFV